MFLCLRQFCCREGNTNIVPFLLGLEFDTLHLRCAVGSWCVAQCRVSFPELGCREGTMSVDIVDVLNPLRGVREGGGGQH